MPENDLESRVKKLEQLHIWGGGIVLGAVLFYFILKRKK